MDPYLEGWLWPDVHHRLATAIADHLARTLRPAYTVRIETRLVEDDHPEEELGIMYPDVHVRARVTEDAPASSAAVAVLEAPLTLPLIAPTTVRVPSIRIRMAGTRTLVTSIEIVSPVNKRGAGLNKFRDKWRQMHRAGVHLVEIDLIRRGKRIFEHRELPAVPYLITVTRAGRPATEAWPVELEGRLPVVPIPLLGEDPDAEVDLQRILDYVSDMGRYGNDLGYDGPPPPPELSKRQLAWLKERVAAWRAANPK